MTEAIAKKARFLQEAVQSLPLTNARVVHGRVEDPATGLPRRAFDMVTVRGVARVATVFDYAEPLLAAPGGTLVLWKGERDLAELTSPDLGSKLRHAHCTVSVRRYALPGVERNANLVILEMT
jgi:16S rRNA (guanine527-N7)-methyltransferase